MMRLSPSIRPLAYTINSITIKDIDQNFLIFLVRCYKKLKLCLFLFSPMRNCSLLDSKIWIERRRFNGSELFLSYDEIMTKTNEFYTEKMSL